MKKSVSVFLALSLLLVALTSVAQATPSPPLPEAPVDVDLTELSSVLVYAEVYNMMTNPATYLGKTIRMSGAYTSSFFDQTNQYYHYVIIADATACCAQGLEFIWAGDHVYPDDYPADQTPVEIVGIFDSYEELGQTYYYLKTDAITVQ